MKFKTKILVVSTNTIVCKNIMSVLESEKYIVDTALSRDEALLKETEDQYSIMIVDLTLLGICGIELLKDVRKKNSNILIITITGCPSINAAAQLIELGAFDFIIKPFTPQELQDMIARALRETQNKKIWFCRK